MRRKATTVPHLPARPRPGLAAILPAVAFLAALPVDPAEAQSVCAPREQIVQRLAEGYGETRQGYGLQNASVVIEIYANAETGTWTIIATRPDGAACAMAAGEAWREGEKTSPLGPPA